MNASTVRKFFMFFELFLLSDRVACYFLSRENAMSFMVTALRSSKVTFVVILL